MGISGEVLWEQANLLNHGLHLFDAVRLVLKQMEIVQALRDDIVHRGPFVQRRRRVLEHHLNVSDDLSVQRAGDLSRNAHAFIQDFAPGQRIDPDHRPAHCGLARAGLAHQGEGLPLIDIKGGVLHGAHRGVALAESNINVFQRQQDFPAVFVQRPMLRQMGGADLICFLLTHDPTLPIC